MATLLSEYAIDVKVDYGATGNGTTDDTTAINNAIAAVNADRGDILVFPPGRYYVPNGITESKDGLIVVGLGHCGFGPGSQWSGMGVQIYTTGTGKWCWDKQSPSGTTTNDYKGGRFENICFVGNGNTAGGFRNRTMHTHVLGCSAVGHTNTSGIGFLSVAPGSPGDTGGLNRYVNCTTQDCFYGFQSGEVGSGGASYTHFEQCIALKFSVGGIKGQGSGFRICDSGSSIMGGHAESHDYGIECIQEFGCRIIGTFFEDNDLYDIALNRPSGTSGTRNLVVCTTSKILVGSHQVGDVIIGGDSNTLTDNGSNTMIFGHEVIKRNGSIV